MLVSSTSAAMLSCVGSWDAASGFFCADDFVDVADLQSHVRANSSGSLVRSSSAVSDTLRVAIATEGSSAVATTLP